MNSKTFLLGAAAYLLATFPLAFVWHLVVFKEIYDELGIFNRGEPIVALGFAVILIQGLLLSYLYPRFYRGGRPALEGVRFGLLMGIFLWSSQVVAAAAKHEVSSLSTWLVIESAYFAVQFLIVGLLIGLVYARDPEMKEVPSNGL